MKKESKHKNKNGFALLIAIITTSILLLVAFAISDIALKQLIITNSSQESQTAFYASDSGIECAQYWDVKSGSQSPFDPATTTSQIICDNQTFTTNPVTGTIIGGPTSVQSDGSSKSNFTINNLPQGCVSVVVTKLLNGHTEIDSRGYDTCNVSVLRRFERGITITY